MAGRGPAPKEPGRRQRRNASPGVTEIEVGARAKGAPALGKAPAALRAWSAETKAWWETWRRSPQASVFAATDWQRLRMLAPLVELYWRSPSKDLLAEVRLNEQLLGATPADRLRLRWDLREPDHADPSPASGGRRRPSRQRKDPRHLALVKGP